MQEVSIAKTTTYQPTTTERVKKDFLNRISAGEDAKEAFLASLKAISEKYNPGQDEYISSCEEMRLGSAKCCKINVTPEAVTKWLAVIDMAIPVIEKIMSLLSKAPNSNNQNDDNELYA